LERNGRSAADLVTAGRRLQEDDMEGDRDFELEAALNEGLEAPVTLDDVRRASRAAAQDQEERLAAIRRKETIDALDAEQTFAQSRINRAIAKPVAPGQVFNAASGVRLDKAEDAAPVPDPLMRALEDELEPMIGDLEFGSAPVIEAPLYKRYEAGIAAEQALAMLNGWRVTTKATRASGSVVTEALRKVADRIRQFLSAEDQADLDVAVECLDVPAVAGFIERAMSEA
jgi:nucleotide-binding universal stress UspA family protein